MMPSGPRWWPRKALRTTRPTSDTSPRVKYKNLYRWEKIFVSGSAVYQDTDECAEGAKVTVESERRDRG